MEPSLLDLLCAPVTHASLRLADAGELKAINSSIRSRLVRSRGGEILPAELEGCLICDADRACYPIQDGLPILIPDAAFPFPNSK